MTSFEVPYIAPKQNYFSEPTHTKKMYFTEANIIEKSFFPVDRQTHLKETGYSEGNNFKNIKYAKQKTDSTTIQYVTSNWLPAPIIPRNKDSNWEKPFPVKGQGVVIYTTSRQRPFALCVQSNASDNWISLDIHENSAVFFMKKGPHIRPLTVVVGGGCGLEKGSNVSYWLSYDRDRLTLKYGKGYRMEETTLLVYDFLKDAKLPKEKSNVREQMYSFFNAEHQIVAKQYDAPYKIVNDSSIITVYDAEAEVELPDNRSWFSESVYEVQPDVQFDRNPFVRNIPPLVLDSSRVTLDHLDSGNFCFSSSLSDACKELYENVKGCELCHTDNIKDSDLPDCKASFADAIRNSIKTESCSLYKKLIKKSEIFGSDPQTTYLRITLGQDFGNSPGIPYVLEIWPSKHRSPIHNHGNAEAAIKVLFGSIRVQIFNKDTSDANARPVKEFDAHVGDVTWISRDWYQTHRLVNTSDDFCATIQCYKYPENECTHWPYFDYVSDKSTIKHFLPDSDFGFQEMCKIVMDEYVSYVGDSKKT